MRNTLSGWARHSLRFRKRHSVEQARFLQHSQSRQLRTSGLSAPRRFALASGLATLSLLLGVRAVSFEEISSGYHTIQSRRIQSTLHFLASKHFNGRATGTPEAELAAAYIASVFQRQGLQAPTSNGARYLQSFDLVQAIPTEDSRVSIEIDARADSTLKMGVDFLPAPWGPDSGVVRGQLSFAGYGVTAPELGYNDFAGVELKGKIAVVLSKLPGGSGQPSWDFYSQKDYDEPLEKTLNAQKAGAAGVIVVLPSNESIPALSSLTFKNAKTSLASDLESVRVPVVFASYQTGERLLRYKEGSEPTLQTLQDRIDKTSRPAPLSISTTVSLQTQYERKRMQAHNVIGIIPGSDERLREECILIGAHYDHIGTGENQEIYYGADDNASGTAGLLKLAEAFQAGPLRPRRTIVLAAWDAEELGLLGSRHYLLKPVFPLGKTAAMIQLDMIGRNEQRPADTAKGEPEERDENNTNTLSIAGAAYSPDLKQWFETCNRRTGLTLRYRYDSGQENLLKRSDHWGFLKAGIPSMFLFTGFHPDYHRPTDTPDKINYEKMERVLRLLYLSAWELSDQANRPRFVVPKTKVEGSGT